jgi:hypothetical protein
MHSAAASFALPAPTEDAAFVASFILCCRDAMGGSALMSLGYPGVWPCGIRASAPVVGAEDYHIGFASSCPGMQSSGQRWRPSSELSRKAGAGSVKVTPLAGNFFFEISSGWSCRRPRHERQPVNGPTMAARPLLVFRVPRWRAGLPISWSPRPPISVGCGRPPGSRGQPSR